MIASPNINLVSWRIDTLRYLLAVVASLVLVSSAAAQTVIGTLGPWGSSFIPGPLASGASTMVDLAHPALRPANVSAVVMRWSGSGCAAGVKIKFFRHQSALQVVAERGPFAVAGGMNTFVMTPPVAVQPGDFIGVATLGGDSCGFLGGSYGDSNSQIVRLSGDVQTVPASAVPDLTLDMDLAGTADPLMLAEVVPAVGTLPGANGASFRTSIQVTNVSPATEQVALIYHPTSVPASETDKSLGFTLKSHQSIAFDDIVATLGLQGLGSLDVRTTSSLPPLVVARVFNDGGSAGTSGFNEKGLLVGSALYRGAVRAIPVPSDLTRFRMNIGVRTLKKEPNFPSTGVAVTVIDPQGVTIGVISKTYPEDYFEQVPLATFVNGLNCPPGSTLLLEYVGPVFVYGSVTDNRTNDASIVLAQD